MSYKPKVLAAADGGTGIANASTITLAGALVTSGANSLTLTTTGATNVTLPTSGTLATTTAIPGSGNLVLIQSQTASGASTLEFTNIPNTYDIIKLVMYGVTSNQASAVLQLQYSYDNGSTYKSDATYVIGVTDMGSGGSGSNWASGQTYVQILREINNTAGCQTCGETTFYNITNGSYYPVSISSDIEVGSTYLYSINGQSYTGSVGAVDAMKIFPTAGTFSGTFKLYGIVN